MDETISRNHARGPVALHAPGLKREIEIESEKYANKLEIKNVWKQVKDGAQ